MSTKTCTPIVLLIQSLPSRQLIVIMLEKWRVEKVRVRGMGYVTELHYSELPIRRMGDQYIEVFKGDYYPPYHKCTLWSVLFPSYLFPHLALNLD